MTTMNSQSSTSMPEVMLAMDVLDTMRHDDRMKDFELADEDRKRALMERVRQAYAAQGDLVTDELLSRMAKKLHEERYIYKSTLSGFDATRWGLYINRGAVAKKVTMALCAVVVLGAAFSGLNSYRYHLQEQALIAEQQRLAEITFELETRIPSRIEVAKDKVAKLSERLQDQSALVQSEFLYSSAMSAISMKTVEEARRFASDLEDLGSELQMRADRIQQAEAEAKKREANRMRLLPMVVAAKDSVNNSTMDDEARDALEGLLVSLDGHANSGDERAFNQIYERLKSLQGFIASPFKIQIVDRANVQTGFSRKNDSTGQKQWYLAVEAISVDGQAYPLPIEDKLVGGTKVTKTWGIHVPTSTFDRVRKDKSDGFLSQRNAGTKPSGTLKIDWSLRAYDGETVNTW